MKSTMLQHFIRHQFFINTCDQMIQDFLAGSSGISAEFGVVQIIKAPVAFCDVGGSGAGCANELVTKPPFFCGGQYGDYFLGNKQPQLAASLPAFKSLKF